MSSEFDIIRSESDYEHLDESIGSLSGLGAAQSVSSHEQHEESSFTTITTTFQARVLPLLIEAGKTIGTQTQEVPREIYYVKRGFVSAALTAFSIAAMYTGRLIIHTFFQQPTTETEAKVEEKESPKDAAEFLSNMNDESFKKMYAALEKISAKKMNESSAKKESAKKMNESKARTATKQEEDRENIHKFTNSTHTGSKTAFNAFSEKMTHTKAMHEAEKERQLLNFQKNIDFNYNRFLNSAFLIAEPPKSTIKMSLGKHIGLYIEKEQFLAAGALTALEVYHKLTSIAPVIEMTRASSALYLCASLYFSGTEDILSYVALAPDFLRDVSGLYKRAVEFYDSRDVPVF